MSAPEKNYKDTILLPETGFPMRGDLTKNEPVRLKKWEDTGLYERCLLYTSLATRKRTIDQEINELLPFSNAATDYLGRRYMKLSLIHIYAAPSYPGDVMPETSKQIQVGAGGGDTRLYVLTATGLSLIHISDPMLPADKVFSHNEIMGDAALGDFWDHGLMINDALWDLSLIHS